MVLRLCVSFGSLPRLGTPPTPNNNSCFTPTANHEHRRVLLLAFCCAQAVELPYEVRVLSGWNVSEDTQGNQRPHQSTRPWVKRTSL